MKIFGPAFTLAASVAIFTPAAASSTINSDFWDVTVGIESGDDYSVCANRNCNTTRATAFGRYQTIQEHWISQGYVTCPGGADICGWETAQFTNSANRRGVYSLDDLRFSEAGHSLQDDVASVVAVDMYNSLSDEAKAYAGTTVGGVPITEGALMGASWFLGAGNLNAWAESGFSVEGLRSLPGIERILRDNEKATVEELHAYLMGRMATYAGVDVSELAEFELETILECEPDISSMMKDEGQAYVDQVVSAAQDETLGFSMLNENFGEMSCMEAIFNGGLSVMFSVPDLSGILDSAIAAVCSEVQNRFADLNSQINSRISETVNNSVGGAIGFGPFSTTAGASASFVPNGRGINFGVTSSDVSIDLSGDGSPGSSSGSIGGSYNAPESSGFDGLFQ